MDHIIANFIEQPIGGYKLLVLLDAHPIPPSVGALISSAVAA